MAGVARGVEVRKVAQLANMHTCGVAANLHSMPNMQTQAKHNAVAEVAVETVQNLRTLLDGIERGLEVGRPGQSAEDGEVLAKEAAVLSALLNVLRTLEETEEEG